MVTYLRQEAGPADLLRFLEQMEERMNAKVSLAIIGHGLVLAPILPGVEKEILSGMRPQGLLS